MATIRRPFEGVRNIVRFNWPFYAVALSSVTVMAVLFTVIHDSWASFCLLAAILIAIPVFVSLFVSWYVYDASGFYRLSFLKHAFPKQPNHLVNIHAGFDETSWLIEETLKPLRFTVFDFYNPLKHTEPSILRARQTALAFEATQNTDTHNLSLSDGTVDAITLIFAAHEIRDPLEQVQFFKECRRILSVEGRIVLVEHLRDGLNFLAFNFGFLHFQSATQWLRCFAAAGLQIERKQKHTPFVTIFILKMHGTPS